MCALSTLLPTTSHTPATLSAVPLTDLPAGGE
jgi:hypothetical protein